MLTFEVVSMLQQIKTPAEMQGKTVLRVQSLGYCGTAVVFNDGTFAVFWLAGYCDSDDCTKRVEIATSFSLESCSGKDIVAAGIMSEREWTEYWDARAAKKKKAEIEERERAQLYHLLNKHMPGFVVPPQNGAPPHVVKFRRFNFGESGRIEHSGANIEEIKREGKTVDKLTIGSGNTRLTMNPDGSIVAEELINDTWIEIPKERLDKIKCEAMFNALNRAKNPGF